VAGVQCAACTVRPDITLSSTAAEVGDLARRARAMTGVQHRHDLADRWNVVARHRICITARLFRFLLAPMRGTVDAATLFTWRGSVS
jgi:hypothetical protein